MKRAALCLLFPLSLSFLGTACVTALEEAPDQDGFFDDEPHDSVFSAQDVDLLDSLAPDEEDGWLQTQLFTAAAPFNRVGVRFDAESAPRMQVRVSTDGARTMGPWQDVTLTYSAEGAHNARIDVADGSTHAQIRMQGAIEHLLSYLAVELFQFQGAGFDAEEIRIVQPGDEAQGLAATGLVVPKSVWGGRAGSCSTGDRPDHITVHHTDTPFHDSISMPARMRQVQSFHMDERGYCDIAYHFLIGQDGKVYEGRSELKLGAHTGGANTHNAGISFIGEFMANEVPQAMLDAGARVMKALKREYGITLNRTKVKGHRQSGTTSTTCPGDKLYAKLQTIIDIANNSTTPVSEPPGFCTGHNLPSCDGAALVVCSAGHEVSRSTCSAGCHVNPSGVADACNTPPPAQVGSFDDVTPSNSAYSAVEKVKALGALTGCGTRRFCPNEPITREAFARLIAAVDSTPVDLPSSPIFTDVPRTHASYAQIQEVGAREIFTSCGNGKFCLGDPVSRAATAVVLRRAKNATNLMSTTPAFTDVSKSHWAYGSVERSKHDGWMAGCTSTTFCPSDSLTRAQAAVLVVRAFGL